MPLLDNCLIAYHFSLQMKQRSATSSNNNLFACNVNINNNSNYGQQQQHLHALESTTSTSQQQQQQLSKSSQIVTEWEDGVIFDVDDPDFCPGPAVVIDKLTTTTNSCAAALRNLNFIGKIMLKLLEKYLLKCTTICENSKTKNSWFWLKKNTFALLLLYHY